MTVLTHYVMGSLGQTRCDNLLSVQKILGAGVAKIAIYDFLQDLQDAQSCHGAK